MKYFNKKACNVLMFIGAWFGCLGFCKTYNVPNWELIILIAVTIGLYSFICFTDNED